MKTKHLFSPVVTVWLVLLFLWSGAVPAKAEVTQLYHLTARIQGTMVVIEWAGQGATLDQSADLIAWSAVTTVSPYQSSLTAVPKFFRLRLPVVGPQSTLLRGYIATQIGGQAGTGSTNGLHDVFLPCVEVYLRDVTSGTAGISTVSDLAGRFTLPVHAGTNRYQVCWKAAGFVEGCSAATYFVSNRHTNVGPVRILPMRTNTTVVYGKVSMKDGSTPRRLEPYANVNSYSQVEVLDASGQRLLQVPVNDFDEYLLPTVPVNQAFTLRAKVEGAQKDLLIQPEANLGGAMFHAIALDVGNSPPRLESLYATDMGGVRKKTGQPGEVVQLTAHASDPEGDPLKYNWMIDAGGGTLDTTTGPQVSWTLPTTPGRYSATVLAYDNNGGYAKSTLSLRVDTLGIPFSGIVEGTDGLPVAGAQVTINGRLAVTGTEGVFQLRVPNAARFVFNIHKPGYSLLSQIYDNGVTGGRWTLFRASVTSVNPTLPIDLVDQRDERNCTGPLSCRLDWAGYPHLAQAQYQDGSNHVVAPFGETNLPLPGLANCPSNRFCGPGIRVQIPANGLQDQNGLPPTGNVDVQLATVDLDSPGQMPGDYTVLQADLTTRVMQSYGAGTVEITAGTKKYNLKPGVTATITIPVDPGQIAAGGPLPPTIPILYYNETTGVWGEENTATLVGAAYVATVSHFSAINCDLVKVGQACLRIQSPLTAPQNMPTTYNLEIIVPQPNNAAPVRLTKFIDNSVQQTHVLYNLPANTTIILTPIRINNNIPLGTFVVNTGGPQNPTSPNLPAFPYGACSTEVTLSDLAYPPASAGQFLHGLYSFEANNLTALLASGPADVALANAVIQATANYYAQIDPCNERLTLAGFKAVNGFPSGSEINVVYANGGDLGFGRNMTGLRNGGDVAAFVTNFGNNTTPDLQDVLDAAGNVNPGATVCMEYSPIKASGCGGPNDVDRIVKFYVYNAAGNRVDRANLDGAGDRPVPQLCMVCHGGAYPGGDVYGAAAPFNNRAQAKLGSKFLPFDLHYYAFAPAPDKASQQLKFKDFNQNIVNNSPPDPVITEIITEMYGGISQIDPNVQDEVFVVSGWNATADRQTMYREVVARTCRTCHAAHSFAPLNFNLSSGFINLLGSAEVRVCLEGVMPHSKVTHDLFWTSINPHQPAIFEVFGNTYGNGGNGWNGTLCGVYTAGGSTPLSYYQMTVEPIFNGPRAGSPSGMTSACTGCHIGAGAGGLNLQNVPPGNSWGNLVNVNTTASVNAGVKRVKPFDHLNSYLWRKIDGSQGAVGGGGSRMPQTGPPYLTPADITIIQNWIDTGAAP